MRLYEFLAANPFLLKRLVIAETSHTVNLCSTSIGQKLNILESQTFHSELVFTREQLSLDPERQSTWTAFVVAIYLRVA